jgi:putative spermidine/putrescine transport system substrate-binding protein
MRRSILLIPLLLILAAAAAFWWWSRPRPVLTIVTWSGTYGRAQASAQILPYGQARRVDARIAQWDGKLDDLRQWIKSGQYGGDVVDMELPAAVAACREGLLEPIDAAALPPDDDGVAAAKDFLPGTIGRCFVASAIYSQTLVCHCGELGALPEIFDAVAHGKKLGLQRGAKINLEMALLADGVKPEDVYAMLATDAGMARAFAKLDTIRRNIVWWSGADEPAALLKSGRADISTMLTEQVQKQAELTTSPVQFTEADVLGVPKGDRRKERAMDYIRFATGPAPLANMVKFAPYMPPRRSALGEVAALPQSATRDFVLSQKAAIEQFFAVDDAFWDRNGAALEARFRAWAAS